VLVTHNETSTGVTNDLEAISQVVKQSGALFLVDGISAIGAIPCPVDEWGIDVMVTGSQKSWMTPPGLVMVSLSPRAWEANARAKMPRFYWDFATAKTWADKGQTPWTPAVSVCYALAEALRLMLDEGLSNILTRHQRIGAYTRQGVKALGFQLFPDEAHASNTVTAVRIPESIGGDRLRKMMREEYDVVLGGGWIAKDE